MKKSSSASRNRRKKTPRSRKSGATSKAKTGPRSSRRRSSGRFSILSSFSGPTLSRDRKLDLLGVLLIGLSLFTLVNMFSNNPGALIKAWLDFLRLIFGWGMFIIPIALLVSGLWLVLRTFRDRLPRLEVEQVIGIALLYFATLVLLHAFLGVTDLAEGLEQARLGRGGGIIGAAILAFFNSAFGAGGTIVALAAWFVVGWIFTAGLSISELVSIFSRGLGWIRSRWIRRRGVVPSPHSTRTSSPQVSTQPDRSLTQADSLKLEAQPDTLAEGGPDAVSTWTLPVMQEVLDPGAEGKADETFDRERARLIEETLQAFGAPAKVVEINRGPTITQFGVEPNFIQGRGGRRTKVKVSKISALADDLALALAAPSIRIEAPVPGKGFVGIEVPNTEVSLVALRDVMDSDPFRNMDSRLRLGLGKDVSGHAVVADLTAMPHLLIAGTTGSGKSVCVNAIVSSLLLQNTPDDLRFVMVDPKRVELTYYNGIPHLLAPVVVELDRVVSALQWVSREMDSRYQHFSDAGTRNIADYNQLMKHLLKKPLPYLVVVIDELADLMIMAPDETERVVTRLAQLARATGIHLVIATQRPSVDVVTGLIKANFPSRIAFAVASSVDSRVILDQPGAERLLGRGDMLFQAPDASAPIRMQGAFVSEPELERLIRYWKIAALGEEAQEPTRVAPPQAIPQGAPLKQAPLWDEKTPQDEELDPVFNEAVEIVREMRRASISLLQRRLRIGYTRAARLIDQLEERGIVGPAQRGSHPREVLDYGELAVPGED